MKEMSNNFRVKIAGRAGQGVKSCGLIFSKFITRSGFYTYNYVEYPSLIKGGHNVIQVNISDTPINSPSNKTDFLLALNQESINKHKNSMSEKSYILFDKNAGIKTDSIPSHIKLFEAPLYNLAVEAGGSDLFINTVALGFLGALINDNFDILKEVVSKEYGPKQESIDANLKALDLGFSYAKEYYNDYFGKIFSINTKKSSQNILVNGDEAAAMAAIASGMQFAAIYPMTPISNLMHTLVKYQSEYKFIFQQPEDEIAGINMAIGASYAGVRSMTATSGGGFCLMTEGYGLAAITETPLVIIEGMRAGPATGLPTWGGQGDLHFILNAHQDEFPRIVLAAGDVSEAFYFTMEAFYLADKYQTPVILILDKNICEHEQTIPMFDIDEYKIDRGKLTFEKLENFNRYELSSDGISKRTVPGTGNFFIANSDEHDEKGFSNELSENRINQMEKRMQKLETCRTTDMPKPYLYGPSDADLTIVSWGSNKGSILDAIDNFTNVNYLHITWLSPFPKEEVLKILNNCKSTLLVECNYSGQLGKLIIQETAFQIQDKELRFDGRPFFTEEVIEFIKKRGGKIKND